ncbi:hypothetical protein BIW11_05384 [Tropilaelaps mercedesae]|uniref:Uncharacterized protein n=1 Tax=Tropilaelaps mercedesae TaxID=418985 RepID=A0A1V9Y2H4_9ACAR|nr:hypothetical protein BIW11_05384 [Tropilaelaps mercedesae]
MSCTHRRSVRFPQVFPSVTVDQGVRELLQQTPLDTLERFAPLGFSSSRGDRENRELTLSHKGGFNCQHHRPSLRSNAKTGLPPSTECQRLCRRSSAYDHGQCFFESDVMECGDAERCLGENRNVIPNQITIQGRAGQSGGLPTSPQGGGTETSRFGDGGAEGLVSNSASIEHFDALATAKEVTCSSTRPESYLDAQTGGPGPVLSFRSPYYYYRTNSNISLAGSMLRQIEDDDSIAGDFNCHHFLDNDSRQRWNLQHGVTDLVRYCWANGPGSSPSPGPVSSSCSDLAAHLATIDRLHDQYLESFRCTGTHDSHSNYRVPHSDNFSDNEDHVRRMRLVYNWFVAGSSPREKRSQEKRNQTSVSPVSADRTKSRNAECKTKSDSRHASKDTVRGTPTGLQQTAAPNQTNAEFSCQCERINPVPT